MKKIGVLLIMSLLLIVTACSGAQGSNSGSGEDETTRIAIGGKNWTEQILLVHLMGTLLEHHTDHEIVHRDGLGSSDVLVQALTDGDIDLFADYTGTGLINVLGLDLEEGDTPESVYDRTKQGYEEKYGFTWLEPLGFSNTFALILKRETAEELNVKTISDLVPHMSNLVLGSDAQFFERKDGYKGLAEAYGIEGFKSNSEMDIGLAFAALDEGNVDVLVGYSTDGRIPALDLVVLEDDKGYFPPYYAAPILREETLNQYPEIGEVLNKLAGVIDETTMAELNSKMDNDRIDERKIAEDFLREVGLID
ncbi:glycine betaine ABC transporter substrate-binding protein [Anaerobacillus sp. MEB173]|uniref:glycine betaine ABC transporter substrate-binding protein n=1 Tax=Anaerobacillus sp. MEB173 TaxID=3383345 RepID=UPI003F927CE8